MLSSFLFGKLSDNGITPGLTDVITEYNWL